MKSEDEQTAAGTMRFNWSNETWGLTFLPHVRMAAILITREEPSLRDILLAMVEDGEIPDLLEGWRTTRDHLKTLVELTDEALTKSAAVLDRLGYGPDNPPPDSAIN